MIEVFLASLIITMATVVYLVINLEKLRGRVQILEGNRITKDILLKPIPERPTLSDIDPDNKALKDVLESIKIEEWIPKVEEDPSAYSSPTYTVLLSNPSNTLGVRIRLRLRKGDKETYDPYLSGFMVYSIEQNNYQTSLSFDNEHVLRNEMILLAWDYIIKYHEEINKDIHSAYIHSIDNIKKKLTTLNRDRKLNKLV